MALLWCLFLLLDDKKVTAGDFDSKLWTSTVSLIPPKKIHFFTDDTLNHGCAMCILFG